MTRATEPIAERLGTTTLEARFTEVSELLSQDEIDKQLLLEALKALQMEMDSFTQNWEEDIVGPLWAGQDTIGETIDRVRTLLVRGPGGKTSKEAEEKLANFDLRLEGLAKAIDAEPDGRRKQRLMRVFGNVVALRKLVEAYGSLDLGPATESIYVKLVQALWSLEDNFSTATFQLERARLVLDESGTFVGTYIGVLQGVIDVEELWKVASHFNSSGGGIGQIARDIGKLGHVADAFIDKMIAYAGDMGDSLQTQADALASNLQTNELPDVDIHAEYTKYLRQANERTQ